MNPIILEFPAYSKQQILDILELECPMDEDVQFYRTFATIVYETVYKLSNNVNELREIASRLYPKFIEPVEKGIGISKLAVIISKKTRNFKVGIPCQS